MKMIAFCFTLAGFTFCNAVYLGIAHNWWMMALNLLLTAVNFYNGWRCLKSELELQYWKGQRAGLEELKARMTK